MATKPSFISRNLIAIVTIPSIILIHLGWNQMQKNRTLVSKEEQIDAPPVTFAKFLWHKLMGADGSRAAQQEKTVSPE